ncbi:MAG: ribonuclease catalytic domain-containing protein [bacterium]|nr:ribonuclease catalytic domain-containing protein [bacterium]
MPASAAETERLPWLQTEAELLSRPLEFARSYDPFQSHEIDDALSVEDLSHGNTSELRVKIHIPDTSAFVGQKFMDEAIKKGWSRYYDDGHYDPLYPNKVVATTSLERGEPGLGAASTTLAFTIAAEYDEAKDIDFYKSRVVCEPFTYGQLARRLKEDSVKPGRFPEETLLLKSARLLIAIRKLQAGRSPLPMHGGVTSGHRTAKNVIAEHMLIYNKTIPLIARNLGAPVLFRNHNIGLFNHDGGSVITELYPDSELFAGLELGWYGRVSTGHRGVGSAEYCHASSPLRRVPDSLNSANLVAGLDDQPAPYAEEFLDEVAIKLATKIKRGLGFTAVGNNEKITA